MCLQSSKRTNDSNECRVCRHWYCNHGSKFQNSVCNGYTLRFNLSDVAIITVKGVDYSCIIHGIIKSDVINLLEKKRVYQIESTTISSTV